MAESQQRPPGNTPTESPTAAETTAPQPQQLWGNPSGGDPQVIYFKRGKKKKGKRKYTDGTRDAQRLTHGVIRSSQRLTNSVGDGLDKFLDRSAKSSRKKRDGAIRDVAINVSKAFEVTSRKAAKAPYSFLRRVPTKAVWSNFRWVAAAVPPPFNLFYR